MDYDNIKGKGFDHRSTDEVREIAAKGGRNSGKSRRKAKTFKQAAKMIAQMGVYDDEVRELLAENGLDPDGVTNLVAATYAAFAAAIGGDIRAFNSLIRLMGEDNDTARLKLEQAEAKREKAAALSTGKLTDLIEGLQQDDIHAQTNAADEAVEDGQPQED